MAYATRAQVEERFGVNPVATWADRNQNQDATEITAAITAALDWATNEIDDHLRGGVIKLPLAIPAPAMIQDLCRELAGAFLYSWRGQADTSDDEGKDRLHTARTGAYRRLAMLKAGRIRLDTDMWGHVPEPQTIELRRDENPAVIDDSENWV